MPSRTLAGFRGTNGELPYFFGKDERSE